MAERRRPNKLRPCLNGRGEPKAAHTPESAQQAIERAANNDGAVLYPYTCPVCGKLHVGRRSHRRRYAGTVKRDPRQHG